MDDMESRSIDERNEVRLVLMQNDIKAIKTGLMHTRFAIQAVLKSLLDADKIPPLVLRAITKDDVIKEHVPGSVEITGMADAAREIRRQEEEKGTAIP